MQSEQLTTVELLFRYGVLLSDRLEIIKNIVKNCEQIDSDIEQTFLIEFDESLVKITLPLARQSMLMKVLKDYAYWDYFLIES